MELSYSLFSFAVEAVEGRVERKDMGGGSEIPSIMTLSRGRREKGAGFCCRGRGGGANFLKKTLTCNFSSGS